GQCTPVFAAHAPEPVRSNNSGTWPAGWWAMVCPHECRRDDHTTVTFWGTCVALGATVTIAAAVSGTLVEIVVTSMGVLLRMSCRGSGSRTPRSLSALRTAAQLANSVLLGMPRRRRCR